MNQSLSRWLIPCFFVLWLFFVLSTFFTVQKPFAAENAIAVGHVFLDLLMVTWILLVALGLGAGILKYILPFGQLTTSERVVLGIGVGLGVLGLLVLTLGLVGLFHTWSSYTLMLVLSLISVPQLLHLWQSGLSGRVTNPPNRFVTIYLLVIGLFSLSLALLPPTDWDGLFYHLTGPKLYIQTGSIVSGFDVPHFNFPSLMEMLFALALLLRGDIVAKLLHFGFGLLLVGMVYIITDRLLERKAAWGAVVVLASMPMLSTLAGWAYNDLALAFYQLASLYALVNHQLVISASRSATQHPLPVTEKQIQPSISLYGWLILSGLLAGLAMGLKYTSFVTPLIITTLIVWYAYRPLKPLHPQLTNNTSPFITAIKNIVIFALAALLVALPWYLKNLIFTGNPVYPFLFDIFGGQYWDGFRAEWYAAAGTGIGWDWLKLLGLPWLLTLGVNDANYWDGRTGPLLLLFLPLMIGFGFSLRSVNKPVELHPLLLYALAHFCFWTLGVFWSRALWQSRLLLPGLVALAPVAGWIWHNLPRFDLPQFSISRFANLAIVLTLFLIVIDMGLLTIKLKPMPYLVGLETREEYLTQYLGAHYAAMQQLNEELPAESEIVFLWEPRSYYCQLNCQPDSILDRFPHLVFQHNSAEAIAQAWADAGITHVLIHRTGLEFLSNDLPEAVDRTVLTALEDRYLHQLFDVGGAYQLYELQSNGNGTHELE